MSDRYTVVCNFREGTSAISEGALAYVHLASARGDSALVVVKSRGGRWIKIWVGRKKLKDFRVKTVPVGKRIGNFTNDVCWDAKIHADVVAGFWITLNSDVDGRTVRA